MLFLSARLVRSDATGARIRELAANPNLDWDRLLASMRKQTVLVNCNGALKECAAELLPDGFRAELSSGAKLNGMAALGLAGQLATIGKLFESNRIPFLSIKGPAFALRAYGDIAGRHAGDLDLLISPSDTERTIALLLDNGYRYLWDNERIPLAMATSFRAELQLIHETGIEIDLHWRFDHNHHRFPLDFHAAHDRADIVEIAGAGIPTLSIEDTLLYHASHGAKHCWERLLWLNDLVALTSRFRFDWERVLERSGRMQTTRSLAEGIFLAHSLLDGPCPSEISERIESDRVLRRLTRWAFRFILVEIDSPPESRLASRALLLKTMRKKRHLFFLGKGFKYRWGVIAPMLWSPKDAAVIRLPAFLSPLYILLRPFLWLYRRLRRWA